MDSTITLVKKLYEENEIGEQVVTSEILTEIFCTIESATRAEWAAAGQNRLAAALVVKTNAANYSGEDTAIINGERRSIYRKFAPNGTDEIELYIEERAGS